MAGPIRRIKPKQLSDAGETARLLRQMHLGPMYSDIINIINANNVSGLQATVSSGSNTMVLTSGSTANLFIGQSLVKTSGSGAFGVTNPIITDIEYGSTTNCTVSVAHSSTGSIVFDALSVSGNLEKFIDAQMSIPIPVRTAEQPAYRNVVGWDNDYNSGNYFFPAAFPYFVISNDGTKTFPDKILLTATGSNLTTFNPSFSVVNGTASLTSTANSNAVFLLASNMTTNSVTIMCTQDGLSTNVTIIKAQPSSVNTTITSITSMSDEMYVSANATSNNLSSLTNRPFVFLNNNDKSNMDPGSTSKYTNTTFPFKSMTWAITNSSNVTAKLFKSGQGATNWISFTDMSANVGTITLTANCGQAYSGGNKSANGSLSKTITLKKSFATGSDVVANAKSLSVKFGWYETKTMEENGWNMARNNGQVGRQLGLRTGNLMERAVRNIRMYLHPDKLRVRVGRALAEYFSVGPVAFDTQNYTIVFADILEKYAFGNFKTMLMEITRQFDMAYWLTYIQNSKATGAILPDENYAREIMQLYTVGLWELKLDGTRKKAFELDTNDSRYIAFPTLGWDQEVPTYIYSQDVANLARIFTGIRHSWGDIRGDEAVCGDASEFWEFINDDSLSTGRDYRSLLGCPVESAAQTSTFVVYYSYLTGGYRGKLVMDSRSHEYELPKVVMATRYPDSLNYANTVTGNTVIQDLTFAYAQANNGMIIIPRRSTANATALTNIEQMNNNIGGSGSERLPPDTVPSSTGVAWQEVDIAITALVNHPSMAPYFAKRMIRMMVTSNPTPAYVARVASVFRNDGTGVVGNLKAVFKAILLDQEARSPVSNGLISRATDVHDHMFTCVAAGPRYKDANGVLLGFAPGESASNSQKNTFYGVVEGLAHGPFHGLSVFGTYPTLYTPTGPVSSNNIICPESYFYTDSICTDIWGNSNITNFNTWAPIFASYADEYTENQLMTSNTQIQSSAQANANITMLINKYNILFTGNTLPQEYTSNLFNLIYSTNRNDGTDAQHNNTKFAYATLLKAIHTSPYSIIRT